jgi:hypothetical protein
MRQWFALSTLAITLGLASTWTNAGEKADNTPPKGFNALFNGKDLTGWQGLVQINQRKKTEAEYKAQVEAATKEAVKHWTVKDGVIHYDGKNNNLQSAKDYGNFELYVDWKIEPKGDSGLYLRGQPQVQIWDSDSLTGGLAIDKGVGSGGLWNNKRGTPGQKPLVNADRPVGEWNTFFITMIGDKVTVVLNGKKVVDAAPLPNFFNNKEPLPTRGPIELQHHGDKLWFKNIYVKELPD